MAGCFKLVYVIYIFPGRYTQTCKVEIVVAELSITSSGLPREIFVYATGYGGGEWVIELPAGYTGPRTFRHNDFDLARLGISPREDIITYTNLKQIRIMANGWGNSGYRRATTLVVDKKIGGTSISGYPKTYSVLDTFGNYMAVTAKELSI